MSTIYKQRVEAGSLIFNVPGSNPSGALGWGIDVMEGWKSSGSPDVNSTNLGNYNDGVSLADYFPIRQRYLTVGGWAYAATEADAETLHDQLVKTFTRNSVLTLTRYEATPRYAKVRRSSSFDTDWSAVQTGFRWEVTLVAADPLLYSAESIDVEAGVAGQSGTGLTFPVAFPVTFPAVGGVGSDAAHIFNRGTAYSPSIRATLRGPLVRGSWKLRNDTTDQEIEYDMGLSLGDVLYIDMSTKTATLNGFPVISPFEGEFLTLAPGANELRLYADYDPSAGLTINAESAWE